MISRGLRQTEAFDPVSIVIEGHPAFAASRRNSAATGALRAGGFTKSVPAVFLFDKSRIPAGVVLKAAHTKFAADGVVYLIDSLDSEPGEPHVRLTANLYGR